jgi:hypothetical protein
MISPTYRISKSQSRQRQAIGRPDKYQIWLIGKLKGIIFGKPLKYKMLWSIGICLGKGYLANSKIIQQNNKAVIYSNTKPA